MSADRGFRDEVRSLFDPHVNSILKKIQEQLTWMQLHGLHRPVVSCSWPSVHGAQLGLG